MYLGCMPLLMMTAAPSWTGQSSNALLHSSARTAIWEDPAWLKNNLWQMQHLCPLFLPRDSQRDLNVTENFNLSQKA